MKALVSGGEGFIGSHLVDALAERGYEVTSLDNESASSNLRFYKDNKKAKYYCFDILNDKLLTSTFELYQYDIVFHLAAESRIQPTIDDPSQACMTNILGTLNMLEASRRTGVKKFIYSSTSSCYGIKNLCPLREDMPTDCLTPYSVSKVAGEGLSKIYNSLHGVKTVTLRYFNVYGDRHPIRGNYAPVIGKFLKQKEEGKPLTIIGDGLQRRDFTHVQDVVEANILAAESDNESILGEIFNVGTGTSYSILDVAKMISQNHIYLPSRQGESRETLADISKIKRELNYSPSVDLEDWMKSQL